MTQRGEMAEEEEEEGRMIMRKTERVKDVKGQGVPCLLISKDLPCQCESLWQ